MTSEVVTDSSASLPRNKRPLPRRFGRYSLFDFIGKGGMAEIYLARATTDFGGARLCVVKQIIPEFSGHPDFAEMLIHEAKLAAQLNHANIVQVFDLGRDDDQLFIAMEYVEGYDLNALLRRCTQFKVPMPMEFAFGILSDVLKALDYAHRRTNDDGAPLGIVHRDVSPSNVLISLEGEVKLCDFGIAHANDLVKERPGEADDAIKGKAGYMSPEHARGERIDARSDVFAAGIVLWELMAGRRVYKHDGARLSLLEQARNAVIAPLPDRGLPNAKTLQNVLDRALSKDREARYASAAAMLRDLEGYMAESRLVPSSLKLGEWMIDKFGTATVKTRRARERAVAAIDRGPLAVVTPISPAPSHASAPSSPSLDNAPTTHSSAPPDSNTEIEPPSSLAASIVHVGPLSSGASLENDAGTKSEPDVHQSIDSLKTESSPMPLAPRVPAPSVPSKAMRVGVAAAIALLVIALAYALLHVR